MLCDVCTCINFEELLSGDQDGCTRHHALYSDLEDAAKAGCQLCTTIESLATAMTASRSAENRLRQSQIWLKARRQGLTEKQYEGATRLYVTSGGKIIAQFEIVVPLDSGIVESGLKLISGRPIALDPASEQAFSVANAWIKECMTPGKHLLCQRATTTNSVNKHADQIVAMPTRLIDVGPADNMREPRLVLSSKFSSSEHKPYAALSHCWGGADLLRIGAAAANKAIPGEQMIPEPVAACTADKPKPLTTLTSNLQDRMQCIRTDILPSTFRDAVLITRKLGLQYIWIDSLCIIQDSKSDWEREAARMADIYKHSYVTIAAEHARDSHQGILRSRLLEFDVIELPFVSERWEISTTVYLRPTQDDWETSVFGSKSALRSRAWVLQESMLAPRTIHFGQQQMFWECKTVSRAEGDVTPIRPISKTEQGIWNWSRNKRFLSDQDYNTNSKTHALTPDDILYMRWYALLEEYSCRKMTYLSDVFPALIGLATEFNTRLNDVYVAGLWRRDLLRGLLWSVAEPEITKGVATYRAPSWSWASIIGEISSPHECLYLLPSHAEIIHAFVTPPSKSSASENRNYYGEVSSGMLKIRGSWTSASYWPKFEDEPWERSKIVLNPADDEGYLFRTFDLGKEETVAERHEKQRSLSLLRLGSWSWEVGHLTGPTYCLILESNDEDRVAVYRRVGIVVMHSCPQEWIDDWKMKEVIIV